MEQAIINLEEAFRREKAAPELLKCETELVNLVGRAVEAQEETLSIEPQNPQEHFTGRLYQLDLDRVKYLLAAYLRTRLLKIQSQIMQIVTYDLTEILSPEEYEFAEKYYSIKRNHFTKSFLKELPGNLRELNQKQPGELKDMNEGPDLRKFVFVRVKRNIGVVQLSDNEYLDLNENGIYLLPYVVAKSFLEDKSLELI